MSSMKLFIDAQIGLVFFNRGLANKGKVISQWAKKSPVLKRIPAIAPKATYLQSLKLNNKKTLYPEV